MEADTDHSDRGNHRSGRPRIANFVLIGFLLIAGFYLITEHRAHLFGWLPFLIFLACPLLHLFMHGGPGAHGGRTDNAPGDRPAHRH